MTRGKASAGATDEKAAGSEAITIKKYANRRLYNTATSSYVTLDHLCQMVKGGVDFVVYDAKAGDDITRQVLTQIIVEEEAKGENLLPISFLRQLISFYGHGLQWMVPSYLEQMMHSLAANQEQMTKAMQETMGGTFPFGQLGELGKHNIAMLERTMKMFSPFGREQEAGESRAGDAADAADAADAGGQSEAERLRALKSQVDQLQAQLEDLTRKSRG